MKSHLTKKQEISSTFSAGGQLFFTVGQTFFLTQLHKKNFPLDGQTRQAKSSLLSTNWCSAWLRNTIVAIWCENMYGYLSADIICSEKRTVFRERSLRKIVSYEERIMSKDKYIRAYFRPKWRLLSLLSFKSFHNTCSFENWGIFSDIPQFQLGNILGNILHASEIFDGL